MALPTEYYTPTALSSSVTVTRVDGGYLFQIQGGEPVKVTDADIENKVLADFFLNNSKGVPIRWQDTGNVDAFGRARVSQVTTQYDAKQLYDKLPLFVDEVSSGTATATHSTTLAQTSLATSAGGDYVVMQTKQRFNYQSGKSQLIFWTFNSMGSQAGVNKKVGYFSSSTVAPYTADLDGIFLQNDGTNLSVNIYRTGTATAQVNQSSWDDPLDGTGASGVTHDFNNNTILAVDFEWLGVGRVRFYVIKDGAFIPFHSVGFTDTTSVYMSSPNKPLRWELRQNDVTAGSLNVICSSVNSEGSLNQIGKLFSSNLGTDFINANSTSTKYAILGIRLNSSNIGTMVDILTLSLLSATNDNVLWEIWLNPTVAGTFTYNTVTNSGVQVAKGTTGGTNTVTGGTLLDSGFMVAQNSVRLSIENAIRLGMSIGGTLDEIVLTANPLSTNLDIYGSITWRELT
jgi:hypothetical protein